MKIELIEYPSINSSLPEGYPRDIARKRVWFPQFTLVSTEEWNAAKGNPDYKFKNMFVFSSSVKDGIFQPDMKGPGPSAEALTKWIQESMDQISTARTFSFIKNWEEDTKVPVIQSAPKNEFCFRKLVPSRK